MFDHFIGKIINVMVMFLRYLRFIANILNVQPLVVINSRISLIIFAISEMFSNIKPPYNWSQYNYNPIYTNKYGILNYSLSQKFGHNQKISFIKLQHKIKLKYNVYLLGSVNLFR